ncbi:pentapeptide repeat-containing protein [Amycolatopsis sp. NPDC051758]|uniref:pentapeptide repeat-containing protein n=1 Tax=Amycolatopsis sp. NPDC051758 TaxID=3363935 RepID=UPI003790C8E9
MSTQPPIPDLLDPVPPPDSPPQSLLVYRPPVTPPEELPVLSHRAMAWAAVALVVLGVGLAVGLLVAFGGGGHSDQLDAIKTAGTIVVGTGGAAALWLTARRQRTSELSLNQVRAAHAATVADAEARRITDLYGKAADQLGSPQAPARLAGLYALERLAQDNPAQRQTIVDLLCAYLRMPYNPPRREPAARPTARPSGVPRPLLGGAARQRASVRLAPPAPRAGTPAAMATDAEAEYQVRRTAQAILFRHLMYGAKDEPVGTFWADISLDLTGAVLGPANLIGCRVVAVDFTGVTFTGDVWFGGTRFGLSAVFTGARFMGEASFSHARFDHDARFGRVTFDGYARFDDADFGGSAKFDWADFRSSVVFTGAKFSQEGSFVGARFGDRAEFDKARFVRGRFAGAQFAGNVYFTHAKFSAYASFKEVRFAGAFTRFGSATLASSDFSAAEFGRNTDFTETRFTGDAVFNMAKFPGGVEFVRTEFDGVNFDGTRFAQFAVFTEAKFDGVTRFYECHFGNWVKFERTRFAADVWFENTKFADRAWFREAEFGGSTRFLDTRFGDVGGFVHARFDGEVVFDDVRFDGPVGFAGARFAQPPEIARVWVRLGGHKRKLKVDSIWPPGTVIRVPGEAGRLPEGWGVLELESEEGAAE